MHVDKYGEIVEVEDETDEYEKRFVYALEKSALQDLDFPDLIIPHITETKMPQSPRGEHPYGYAWDVSYMQYTKKSHYKFSFKSLQPIREKIREENVMFIKA